MHQEYRLLENVIDFAEVTSRLEIELRNFISDYRRFSYQ